jgi:AraC-like DNA-binding protein
MTLARTRDEVAIHTAWEHAPGPVPPRLVDASLASLLMLLRRGTGRPLAPKRVELTRARRDAAMLTRFFGCPVHFGGARDALVLDAGLLAAPFATHNAALLDALVPGLETQLAPRRKLALLDGVRAALVRRMSGERPSVEKVARELALSPRTLQRRLGELGLSYQQVLDEVRHTTARRLLREPRFEVAEIAFMLGFEELNSFTRAFTAWEGTTPKRWREAMPLWRDRI